MNILILGTDGQVGGELARGLGSLGRLTTWSRRDQDLTDTEGLESRVRSENPEVILNAAAYTAVDRAESEPALAFRVNRDAVGVLARTASDTGALLVHYSTDYVFDGGKASAYTETDAPNPLNTYGRSKLAGEEAIRASGCRHLIFRTSWVFAARGNNFIRTVLRLASERDELRIVGDQHGAPTGARLIAEVTRRALGRAGAGSGEGTYHLAAGGETTWHAYARFVVEEWRRLGGQPRVPTDRILPIAAADYPQPAARPSNSRLDTGRLESWLGPELPRWEDGVRDAVREIVQP
jgi:dTDP-4-dehydrorhamnose reductase